MKDYGKNSTTGLIARRAIVFAITGLVPRKACVNVRLSDVCLMSDVTHRIGLQDCRIGLRAIFKKDRVLGFLWCFCKCVFFTLLFRFVG